MSRHSGHRRSSHDWSEDIVQSRSRDLLRFLIAAALPVVVIVAAMYLVAGRSGIEKGLTRFLQPDAAFWLLLTGLVAIVGKRAGRREVVLAGATWLAYTLAASPWFCDMVYRRLEGPYLTMRPLQRETPLDRIVVLGGGTCVGGNGEAQLGPSGDRVMVAARMLLTDRANSIICTGVAIEGLSDSEQMTPAEQTIEILSDLGIGADRIETIGGRNTSEEISELKSLLENEAGDEVRTLGIVTSAWHLPRAMRLARDAGLQAEPIPANFRTEQTVLSPLDFVPSGEAARHLGDAIKEEVAGWVGR